MFTKSSVNRCFASVVGGMFLAFAPSVFAKTITFEVTGVLTLAQNTDGTFPVPVAVGDTFTYDYTVNTATPQSFTIGGINSAGYYGAIVSASFRVNGGPPVAITMVPNGLDPFVSLASGINANFGGSIWEDDYQAGIAGTVVGSGQAIVGGVQFQTQGPQGVLGPFFLSDITLTTVPKPLSAAESREFYLNGATTSIAATFSDVTSVAVLKVPYVVPGITGTLGSNGWYTSPTTLTWYVTGTPAPTKSGCGKVVVPNTKATTYTCSATNTLSSATESVTIKRDMVAPKATIRKPVNGATYALGSLQIAAYSCSDATSGVATCSGTVPDKTAFPTSAVGANTFTVNATDNAGNTASSSVTYTVQ